MLLVDTTSPAISYCPEDIETIIELGKNGTYVNWTEPRVTDLSGIPEKIQSHEAATEFPLGVTSVTYTFVDSSNNTANCTFSVTVDTGK